MGKGPSSPGEHMFCNHNHFIYVFIQACDLSLERFQGEPQLCSQMHFNQNSHAKFMFMQSFGHICSVGQHGSPLCARGAIPLGSNLNHVPLGSKYV